MSPPDPQPDPAARVTQLLHQPLAEDRGAADELLVLVYEQLKRIAQQRMADERAGHTLQATALVHEAYARLVRHPEQNWAGRAQFFFAASQAMRRILIEHARARAAVKRGGDPEGRPAKRAPINILDLAAADNSEQILMLDEALARLEREDPQVAQIVRLRFFAGLTGQQAADVLGISPSTVDREWAWARAWLFRALAST
jgi:RNA polymerase sigma factor (TIGR02999 family)